MLKRAGFDPLQPQRQGADGHAGDLPARRAVPGAGRGARSRPRSRCCTPRAPPGQAVRPPDAYGRYVSVPGLPAARPLHHQRPRADAADPQGALGGEIGRVLGAVERVGARPRPLRRAPPQGRARPRGRHRPARAPAGRRHPVLARRLRCRRRWPSTARSAARGSARSTATRSRRRTRRTSRPRRGGRPRHARGGSGDEGIDLPLYEPRRRGTRRGPAQGLPDRLPAVAVARCCRCCRRWASRSSTSGPTS